LNVSILDRLEEIRINERLKKKDFEEILGKSSGYIGTLKKNEGVPGSDVLIKLSDYFRKKYSLDWILIGEGEMLKENYPSEEEKHDSPNAEDGNSAETLDLKTVRDEIRGDLKLIFTGMTEKFETISDGVFHVLKDTQKLTTFIDKVDLTGLNDAGKNLKELIKERN